MSRFRPSTCSICKRKDNDIRLVDGCTWLCTKCRQMILSLKEEPIGKGVSS